MEKIIEPQDVVFVTVMKDRTMYDKCIANNPYVVGHKVVVFDNNEENLSIPARYNSFISTLADTDDLWIVFCHEDWRLEEEIEPVLARLKKDRLYGPIGIFLQHRLFFNYFICSGGIMMREKDGSHPTDMYSPLREGRADSVDCQCLIVHSSLIRKYNLRFDENLSFHMYVEDFCVTAHDKYRIHTNTCAIKCTHFSYGNINQSFYDALNYVDDKFKDSRKAYMTTVGQRTAFGRGAYRTLHHARFLKLANLLNGIFIRKNR